MNYQKTGEGKEKKEKDTKLYNIIFVDSVVQVEACRGVDHIH